jgi:hypothetical protein
MIDSTPNLAPEQAARAKHQIDVRMQQRALLLPSIDAAARS